MRERRKRRKNSEKLKLLCWKTTPKKQRMLSRNLKIVKNSFLRQKGSVLNAHEKIRMIIDARDMTRMIALAAALVDPVNAQRMNAATVPGIPGTHWPEIVRAAAESDHPLVSILPEIIMMAVLVPPKDAIPTPHPRGHVARYATLGSS